MDLVILENYQRSLLETIFFSIENSVLEDCGEGERKSECGGGKMIAVELPSSNFEELQLELRKTGPHIL